MKSVDMSPAAVTARLARASQLRRLSLALRHRERPEVKPPQGAAPTHRRS